MFVDRLTSDETSALHLITDDDSPAILINVGLAVGDTVGDYVVEAVLGQGGMGAVFLVRNLIYGRQDALKVLVADVNGHPQIAERFLREIKVQASLSHPNIASLHTALRHENQLLMVMEYVDGDTLETRMRPGYPLGSEGVAWTIQLLSALEYAHQRGVVHRDIKPANVMISRNGTIKLLDFGIASRQDSDFRLTATGAPIGTVYYMSPEQIRTQALDGRSDIYSTGIMLYEALTSRRPIDEANAFACMQQHLSLVPLAPCAVNPAIPVALSNAIMQAIEKDPARRFQSAAEFQSVLVAAIRGVPTTDTTLVMPVPPARTAAGPTPVPEGWDPKVLEQARQDLAQFIGPMAKVLVKRAVQKVPTVTALYAALAEEIADEKDRRKFLSLRR